MARPTVSAAAEFCYERLGPYAAIDGEGTDWALLRFCHVLTSGSFSQLFDYVTEDEDGTPIWGRLLDPDLCPAEALPYLAQFVGIDLAPGLSESEQRAAIKLPERWSRGGLAAMTGALKRELTGSKVVLIEERYLGNAYRLWVRTFASETPDVDRALTAILSQKPAGVQLNPAYEAITGQSYSDLAAAHPDYDDVLASYDDYLDVRSTLPPP